MSAITRLVAAAALLGVPVDGLLTSFQYRMIRSGSARGTSIKVEQNGFALPRLAIFLHALNIIKILA